MGEIMICEECKKDFLTEKELHYHLRSHKIKVEDYYKKFFPRFDLFSKDPIPFKNRTQYLETNFISKSNLRQWLKRQDIETAQNYCKGLLEKRIKDKEAKFAFTQVELRSLPIPAINYFDCIFKEGYYKLCADLGLELKFKKFDKKYLSIENKVKFIKQDSREQTPLNLDFPIEITTLNYADYAIDNSELNENVYVERKSLADLLGTVTSGLERFSNELERALIDNAYIVVLVEESIEHALSFNHLPHIFCKMHPDAVFHNIRGLLQRYNNFQIAFCNGRKETSRILKRVLFEKGLARNTDIQLGLDIGVI